MSVYGGYYSTGSYQLDPNVIIHNNGPYPAASQYSTPVKAFNPVVPSNTQPSLPYSYYGPTFDPLTLEQTHALKVPISTRPKFVSLACLVQQVVNNMGTIFNDEGKNIGSCTLISPYLILLSRHQLAEESIDTMNVYFGLVQEKSQTRMFASSMTECCIEESKELDYAIVKLSSPVYTQAPVVLNLQDDLLTHPALLHYPLGKPLQVSMNTIDQPNVQSLWLRTWHDSDCFSSGGAYFDPQLRFSAIHLGTQLDGDHVHVSRYAMTLKRIVEYNPSSILKQVAAGQQVYYPYPQTYLYPHPSPFLISLEGRESEKKLRALVGNLKSIGVEYNKNGTIKFTQSNLQKIKKARPAKFQQWIDECTGISDVHGVSRQYSVTQWIESDHTIPHHVWLTAKKNATMQNIAKGPGSRLGENDMPAITIPYDKHRVLRTTGSSDAAKAFRKKLVAYCDNHQVDVALRKCFKEYVKHGIDVKSPHMKAAAYNTIDRYVALKLITPTKATALKKAKGIFV